MMILKESFVSKGRDVKMKRFENTIYE